MKTENRLAQGIAILLTILLVSGCAGQAATTDPVTEAASAIIVTEPAVVVTDPLAPADASAVGTGGYQPVSVEVCQILQEGAAEALELTFTMESNAPFNDYSSGETGQGCTLTATTNGASITDPYDTLMKLVNGFIGWTEEPDQYGAGGPTGIATGMTRDAGLMLISVGWEPSPDANCPADQPISMCPLTPEQKLYTIKIEVAQK